MPVYSFRCCNCGNELDYKLKFNDPSPEICPVCQEECLTRVYKPVRIIFKGPGFYATDNKSPSGVKNGKVETGLTADQSETSEKSSEKSDKKAETKSEPKVETKSVKKTESTASAAAS